MIPPKLPRSNIDLINGSPKAVAHLRSQLERQRLGLLFGAGISLEFQFPEWEELVKRIAQDADVDGEALLAKLSHGAHSRTLSSLTQIMFGRFRQKRIETKQLDEQLTFLQEQEIRSEWLRLIHRELYRKVDFAKRDEALSTPGYLNSFLPLIKGSSMTVNYNFDDTLERLLFLNRSPEEKLTTRGFETVFRPNAQFQKNNGVIYHPNGYLPSTFEDGTSPDLVFSDDSFQDQLISVASGQYVQLSNFLFQNTCLLIGLSLKDSTLQHLLRQSAVSSPGHVHYLVQFVESDQEYDPETFQTIFDANFSAYNVYTLFLDKSGISHLSEAVTTPSRSLAARYPDCQHKFVYYIIGGIGAGKSTATSNLQCLTTYDEWIDERLSDMARPEAGLTRERIIEINEWTAEQFRKKNLAVIGSENGIHLIDRCPLDPLTFGDASERKSKAENLLAKVTNRGSKPLQKGHVILLDADLADIQIRISYKHKYWPEDRLTDLLTKIKEVYSDVPMTTLCTRGRNANAVAREIVKVIFTCEYHEVDLGKFLGNIAEKADA